MVKTYCNKKITANKFYELNKLNAYSKVIFLFTGISTPVSLGTRFAKSPELVRESRHDCFLNPAEMSLIIAVVLFTS